PEKWGIKSGGVGGRSLVSDEADPADSHRGPGATSHRCQQSKNNSERPNSHRRRCRSVEESFVRVGSG
ncbi:hypothetical protein PFISCL1PPCAC_13864, partial [Pristionchus fissidentatus]